MTPPSSGPGGRCQILPDTTNRPFVGASKRVAEADCSPENGTSAPSTGRCGGLADGICSHSQDAFEGKMPSLPEPSKSRTQLRYFYQSRRFVPNNSSVLEFALHWPGRGGGEGPTLRYRATKAEPADAVGRQPVSSPALCAPAPL